MMPLDDRRYNMILDKLREWVDELTLRGEGEDKKVLYRIAGPSEGTEQAVTPRTILNAVETHTPLGLSLVDNWFDMALNHIVKAPFS